MKRRSGFTLLELLVVMAIVVLVTGLVVIHVNNSDSRNTLANADRLSMALEGARDAAIYSGKPVAFSSDGEGYQFWMGDDAQHKWLAVGDNTGLAARRLKGARITKQIVNGTSYPLGERLIFSADGLSEPFTLMVTGEKARAQVQSDALGRISVQELDEDDTQ